MPTSTICLLEEYRLIERTEHDVNGAWKGGAHMLLFFLAFIFGSFCTFSFHMLMHMFDEKCVLYPKLQSLTSLRHNVIYEFIPAGKDAADLPVEFLSTQWMEKSACYLPTYVPLVSGIFGLVWTTMFLMCSTGGRTFSGVQRSWRILPPVFLFSLAMGGVCIYSSTMTHFGLEELCKKLSEITGSPTCTYTVNVATLVYERRIRGVYQATRLTILSAWLHTSCWLLSAVLALVRVLMVVDFQLVRINVDLIGDIDAMLETQETHIRTFSPDRFVYPSDASLSSLSSIVGTSKVQFKEKDEISEKRDKNDATNVLNTLYYNERASDDNLSTDNSLVLEEQIKLARNAMLTAIDKQHHFIAKMVFDLIDNLSLPGSSRSSSTNETLSSEILEVVRQYGESTIILKHQDTEDNVEEMISVDDTGPGTSKQIIELKTTKPSTLAATGKEESVINITPSMREKIRESLELEKQKIKKRFSKEGVKKSSLKHVSIQTERRKKLLTKKSPNLKVKISEPTTATIESDQSEDNTDAKADKKSQTRKKEKQD